MQAHTEVTELDHAPDACALFAHLAQDRPDTLLLESTDGDGKNDTQSLLLIQSALRVEARGSTVTLTALTANGRAALDVWPREDVVAAEDTFLRLDMATSPPTGDHLQRLRAPSTVDVLRRLTRGWRRTGAVSSPLHVAGIFAYDLVEQREPLPAARADPHDFPDFVFYLPELLIRVDHQHRCTQIITHRYGAGPDLDPAVIRATREAILSDLPEPGDLGSTGPTPAAAVDQDDEAFAHTVRALKEHIAAGDVFQIVPSRTFVADCPRPLAAYKALRRLNPSPYLFFVQGQDFCLFGSSPEACVRVRSGQVEVHPIAGTRPRGRTDGAIDPELDSRLEAELRLDDKELSEHMMLVDLARNDVARICRAGTRRVTRLLEVARYSHVMHLCSVVTGSLQPGLDGLHAYLASANMGTLVGAPKVEAATLLRRYEPDRRGPYGGGVGYYTDQDELETAIIIRAALVHGGQAYIRAGAGVVLHSDPAAEAAETRAKAGAVLRAIALANLAEEAIP